MPNSFEDIKAKQDKLTILFNGEEVEILSWSYKAQESKTHLAGFALKADIAMPFGWITKKEGNEF